MEYYKTDYGYAFGQAGQPPLGKIVVNADDPSRLVIEHTEVDLSLRGQGRARDLVMLVVAEARDAGTLILPRCPYALAVLERDPSLSALIARS